MVYDGTNNSELIVFHTADNAFDRHFIELYKSMDETMFSISCCCDRDWGYKFYIENNSDYERVKFCTMQAVFECEDMDTLLDTLSEIFEDGFSDILIEDECDGTCDCCENNGNNDKYFINENENNKYLN